MKPNGTWRLVTYVPNAWSRHGDLVISIEFFLTKLQARHAQKTYKLLNPPGSRAFTLDNIPRTEVVI